MSWGRLTNRCRVRRAAAPALHTSWVHAVVRWASAGTTMGRRCAKASALHASWLHAVPERHLQGPAVRAPAGSASHAGLVRRLTGLGGAARWPNARVAAGLQAGPRTRARACCTAGAPPGPATPAQGPRCTPWRWERLRCRPVPRLAAHLRRERMLPDDSSSSSGTHAAMPSQLRGARLPLTAREPTEHSGWVMAGPNRVPAAALSSAAGARLRQGGLGCDGPCPRMCPEAASASPCRARHLAGRARRPAGASMGAC